MEAVDSDEDPVHFYHIRIKVLNRNFTIVGVYAPVEGKEQDTEEFYRELQKKYGQNS